MENFRAVRSTCVITALTAVFALCACSAGSDSNASPSDQPGDTVSAPETDADSNGSGAVTAKRGQIGSEGGTVAAEGGATITVPSGTLPESAAIEMRKLKDSPDEALPDPVESVGEPYRISASRLLSAHGANLNVAIPFGDAEPSGKIGVAVHLPEGSVLDGKTPVWEMPAATVVAKHKLVVFQLNAIPEAGMTVVPVRGEKIGSALQKDGQVKSDGASTRVQPLRTKRQASSSDWNHSFEFRPWVDSWGNVLKHDGYVEALGNELARAAEAYDRADFKPPEIQKGGMEYNLSCGGCPLGGLDNCGRCVGSVGRGPSYSAYVVYLSVHCSGGKYNPFLNSMKLCVEPTQSAPSAAVIRSGIHELFHGVQAKDLEIWENEGGAVSIGPDWIVEGTARLAEDSIRTPSFSDYSLERQETYLRKIDVPLTAGGHPAGYLAQDFWYYVGKTHNKEFRPDFIVDFFQFGGLGDGTPPVEDIRSTLRDKFDREYHTLYWNWAKNQAYEEHLPLGPRSGTSVSGSAPCQPHSLATGDETRIAHTLGDGSGEATVSLESLQSEWFRFDLSGGRGRFNIDVSEEVDLVKAKAYRPDDTPRWLNCESDENFGKHHEIHVDTSTDSGKVFLLVSDIRTTGGAREVTVSYESTRIRPGAFKDVDAGGAHTCGVKNDGTVECWGSNSHGKSEPPEDATFLHISAGDEHTCGLTPDGVARCWGQSFYGQLNADGKTMNSISAATRHTCGIDDSKTVKCWGMGTDPDEREDEQVDFDQAAPPEGQFVEVSAGTTVSCAIDTDRQLECWGQGQDPSSDEGRRDYDQATPPDGQFRAVSTGAMHACAINQTGSVQCWGAGDEPGNNEGRLDFDQATAPDGSFEAISAGGFHTCGLRTDGSVTCWGGNTDGQADAPGGSFQVISAGETHSCGIKTDGTPVCWGDDEKGQSSPPSE